jgi:serine phosphatase RsbU (regulator of sigma subunit)
MLSSAQKYYLFIFLLFLIISPIYAQKTFKGRVFDIVGKPVKNVKISVNNKTSRNTNEQGEFRFFAEGNEKISSVDAYKENLIMLDWSEKENEILVIMSPPATIKGKVLSLYKTPLSNVKVTLTGIPDLSPATTDEDGNFALKVPQNVTPNQKYKFLILGYASGGGEEFVVENNQKDFYVLVPKATLLVNKDSLQSEDRKRALLNERQYFLLQRQRLEKKLRNLQKRHKENPDKLETEIEKVENLLKANKKALAVVQDKAEGAIAELLDMVSEKDKQNKETKDKLNQTLSAAELQQSIANRNIIIFTILVVFIVFIALILFFNLKKIRKQKNELNKNYEETKMIIEQMKGTNEVLKEAAIILDRKNQEIQTQKKNLEDFNKQLTDSIRYAQTIQKSALPDEYDLRQVLKDYFVWNQPRDIVSGDFYWCHKTNNEILIAVADCTGHGVPGAFMTMMAISLLNEIVKEQGITNPAEVMTLLHKRVISNFKHQINRDGDGLDIGILNINIETKNCAFVGAKIPLYFVQNNELKIIKGLNMSIGSTLKGEKTFENQYFEIKGDEVFYICSDGIQDQLGYANKQSPRRKFMKIKLMEWFMENYQNDFNEQKNDLMNKITSWKSRLPQTDDILIMGFKPLI